MSLSEEIVLPSGSSLDYTLEYGSNTEIDKPNIINDREAASPKLLQVSTIGKVRNELDIFLSIYTIY